MLSLIALMLAAAPVSPSEPPMVKVDQPVPVRSARLLDADGQAKLAELDRLARTIQPSAAEASLRTIATVSAVIALIPVGAAVLGGLVGIVIGASYGVLGALIGAVAVIIFIPAPVWIAAALLGVGSGICFGIAGSMGSGKRDQMNEIRAQRRALLYPAPMATVANF